MRLTKAMLLKYALAILSILALTTAVLIFYVDSDSNQPGDVIDPRGANSLSNTQPRHQPVQASPLASPSDSEKSTKQITNLKQEQAQLTKKFEKLQSNVDELRAEFTAEDPKANQQKTVGPDPAVQSPEAEEVSINAQIMAQIALLDDTLETEAPDLGWSNQATNSLQAKFAENKDTSMEMIDVQCRSSLCRMEIAFIPGEHENRLLQIQNLVPWSGEMFFHIDNVNTGVAVVFIARENHSLSKVSN